MEETATKMEIKDDGDGRLRRKKRPLARPVENVSGTWYTENLPRKMGKIQDRKGQKYERNDAENSAVPAGHIHYAARPAELDIFPAGTAVSRTFTPGF